MTRKQMFMSPLRCGKTIMQKRKWDMLRCNDCDGELELIKNNEFEEVKQCKDCDNKFMLIKKIRKELKG